jgi:signal peptidase I
MIVESRGTAARIGIVALNLISPGLGLLRVQQGRAAAIFLIAPWIFVAGLTAASLLLPAPGFFAWVAFMALALIALLAVFVAAMLLSWQKSARRLPANPWWARWYGIAGILITAWTLTALLPDELRSAYRTFYVPAEAMAPTLLKDDRLVAAMGDPGQLSRGDIVLFRMGESTYIKRVAALPGDRIAMEEGVVVLNGQPVVQRLLRVDRFTADVHGTEARRLAEQFPGEASPHEIYDRGYTPGDDMAEQQVATGHVFVLGDNRDLSADSRFSRDEWGVDQLPVRDIVGRALFYLWGPSERMAEALNR